MNILKLANCGLLCLLFFVSSCSKDSNDAPSKTPAQLLTCPTCWKYKKVEINDGTGWKEEVLDDCEKDDCLRFLADGMYIHDAGALKCDPLDSQTNTGPYVLSADGKTLTIDLDSIQVEKLDATTLLLSDGSDRVTFIAQ